MNKREVVFRVLLPDILINVRLSRYIDIQDKKIIIQISSIKYIFCGETSK